MRTRSAHRAWRTRRVALLAVVALALPLSGCLSSDGSAGADDSQGPDPVVIDFPVAYVKRPVPPAGEEAVDARHLLDVRVGADLYLREKAAPSAVERNVTVQVTGGKGDVRDVESSWDGNKLIFALRLPLIEDAEPEDQPTWNIWEYDRTTDSLRRVIPSDLIAEEGHDVAPHYLPDGRIVFSSTRQRQSRAILLDEGKPQYEIGRAHV